MTSDELTAATAVFDTREAAQAAADAAMPRRKHNRPHPQPSGWHWARAVPCPVCGAAAGTECSRAAEPDWRYQTLHREREAAARAAGRAADRWIVTAYANAILLRDGSMYDHQGKVTIRP